MSPRSRSKPIPDTYRRVTPGLIVRGGSRALEFYSQVFGATERMRFAGPDGSIIHAEIQIGDSIVMVDDESPRQQTKAPPDQGIDGSPFFLYIYVDDVDQAVARAVELGATLRRAPEDQFYGDRNAHIIDPFGHSWTIATHIEDVEPQEMKRRMGELVKGATAAS